MKFQYYNPIRFHFGTDAFDQIPELCEGHKVMLVYGEGSIKENGVYDRITTLLKEHGIPYVDYGGQTGAEYQGILDGIALVKKEKIDAIVEIGGASAMDTGKAIAFGAVHENLEDYIEGKKVSDNCHLFNVIIPTYPSTGSEANGVCDIMEYKGGGAELFGAWPDYCLMDPSATSSLDKKSTTYSALVCFIQTSAWYIGNHQNDIAKGFAKTVLQVLLDSLDRLLKNPEDQRARENIMWASCVNTMGVFRSGVDQFYPWTLFSVGYIPRVAHQVSYREALVIAYLSWLKGISKYHMSDICTLFTEVFGISTALDDESIVDEGCARLKKLMEEGEIPVSLSAYGSCPTKEYIAGALNPEDFGEFTQDEMYEMIAKCYA
ncbi:MAG: iron-containing alcohol dehydrogenase [Lachnospiraceae bacterium]|nr:iron-containing alcohol dehydrogenase [Lachnospiraceae bacterium]